MRIRRLSLISGAAEATGLTVVIDVFRAFTTAAYLMANGAERIIPVSSVEEAKQLKRLHPKWVLMGERGGIKLEGFDYGNSPWEINEVDFTDKTVIQTTGAGTQGVVKAVQAEDILLGSFVTAGAIVQRIRKSNPETVSLVAMGSRGVKPNTEDDLCASFIQAKLSGENPDFEQIKKCIRKSPSGRKFFDKDQLQFIEEDYNLALELDRFDFVLRVVKGNGLYAVKENP